MSLPRHPAPVSRSRTARCPSTRDQVSQTPLLIAIRWFRTALARITAPAAPKA